MKLTRIPLTPFLTVALTLLLAMAATATPFHSAKGYSITPPAGWQMEKRGCMGTDAFFFGTPAHGFAPNINVVVTQAPPRARLEDGLTQVSAMLPRVLNGYKRLAQGYTAVDGTRAFYTMGLHQVGTPPRPLKMHQIVALKNGRIYTFTCTCLAVDYAQFSATFTVALKSIHWTK